MILALYGMVICFCAYVAMMGYDIEIARAIVLMVGITLFWVANICYDNTIYELKKKIRELEEKINK